MTGISNRRRSKGNSRPDRGFTLLEVVVSMGLIAVVLVAIFRLQAQSLGLQYESRFLTTANLLLQERISAVGALEPIEEGAFSGDFGEDFPEFAYRVEVLPVKDWENLLKIRIDIVLTGDQDRRILQSESYVYKANKT
jgi:general secretion pathway protein I